MRKAYGFRTFRSTELARNHVLGKLSEPLLVLFAYLTGLRIIGVRRLTRAQVVDKQVGDVIEIQPSKTKDSTGVTLDVVVTPDILDVRERARAIDKVKGFPS